MHLSVEYTYAVLLCQPLVAMTSSPFLVASPFNTAEGRTGKMYTARLESEILCKKPGQRLIGGDHSVAELIRGSIWPDEL